MTQGRSRKRVRSRRSSAAPAHIGANLACSARSVCANSYQNASSQGAGAGHAGAVGLVAFQQRFDVGHAKATRQLFVHALAALAPALDVERTQVVALHQAEVSPGVVQTSGDERVAGNAQRALNHGLKVALLALGAHSKHLVLHVFAVQVAVLRQHLQGSGVGGQLVIGIVEVGLTAFVQRLHAGNLALHLVFDQRVHLVQKTGFVGHALSQHQADGALHVVAFFQSNGFCFCADCPGGCGFKARRPKDHAQVGPDRRVLVREHDHLQAVVRHVEGQVFVDIHHRAAEVFSIAAHR